MVRLPFAFTILHGVRGFHPHVCRPWVSSARSTAPSALCWHLFVGNAPQPGTPAGPAVARAACAGRLLLRAADRRVALHPDRIGRHAARVRGAPRLAQARSARGPEQTCGAAVSASAIRPAHAAPILASARASPTAAAAVETASPTLARAVSTVDVVGPTVVVVVVAAADATDAGAAADATASAVTRPCGRSRAASQGQGRAACARQGRAARQG